MIKKPKIILTFDYELFLGSETGSLYNCVIRPTDLLLKKLDKYNIKGIFFIDILYYIKLLEYSELKYQAILIENQLKKMVETGHRIELHLHPQWLDAVYKNKKWSFSSYRYYRFNKLPEEKKKYAFSKGIFYLEKIAKEVDLNYKVRSFRAGGWCIQPFEDFYPYFRKYGIKYESSVAHGRFGNGEGHYFDFRNFPDKSSYYFNKSIEKVTKDGDFLEFPISVYKINFFERVYKKLCLKKYSIFGDGKSINLNNSNNFIKNLKAKLSSAYEMYSIQGNPNNNLVIKKLLKENKDLIVFISHPKVFTENTFLLIDLLKQKKFCFITFQEYERNIKNNRR